MGGRALHAISARLREIDGSEFLREGGGATLVLGGALGGEGARGANLYLCRYIYIYKYIYIYIYMYIYIYVFIYPQLYIYIYRPLCTWVISK